MYPARAIPIIRGMNDRGFHFIEDDLSESWVEDWAGVGVSELEVLLAKDATIGAFTFSAIAALLSQLGVAEEQFAHAWWLALIVGLVLSAVTAAAGWLDYFTISPGTPLRRTALTHGLTNVAALVLLGLAAIFGHGAYADSEVTAWPFLLTL